MQEGTNGTEKTVDESVKIAKDREKARRRQITGLYVTRGRIPGDSNEITKKLMEDFGGLWYIVHIGKYGNSSKWYMTFPSEEMLKAAKKYLSEERKKYDLLNPKDNTPMTPDQKMCVDFFKHQKKHKIKW